MIVCMQYKMLNDGSTWKQDKQSQITIEYKNLH